MRIPIQGYWELFRRYLHPQRSAAATMAVLLFGSVGFQIAGPRVARTFINQVQAGTPEGALLRTAALFIAISLGTQALKVGATYVSERVAWTASNHLRLDLAAHLLRLDVGFHKERTPGELIERVDGDVSALAGFFSSFIVQLAGSVLLLAGIVVSLAMESVWLGLAFGAFVVVVLWVLAGLRRLATPFLKESREQSALFYGYLGEVIAASEDIRSSGAVGYALRRFDAHLRRWFPILYRAEIRGDLVWVTAIAAFGSATALAFGVGGGLYRLHAVPLGTVYMAVAYAGALEQPIEAIRKQLRNLQQADAGIARVRELLEIRSRLADGSAGLPGGALAVELREVSFRYPAAGVAGSEPMAGAEAEEPADAAREGALVLDRISLRLAPGRTLGLLGRTGSGKTTVARLLARLYDPTEGDVRLGGVSLRQARLGDLRARVGLVTQDVQLFDASLRDNLTFFDGSVPDEKLVAMLETLGLHDWLSRLPRGLDTPVSAGSLSAGEAQLLAFARVFLKDPGLVILDEASSRLDPATEALLDRAVARLLDGRTAVIIAHRLAMVEHVDEVLILDNGRILEHGPRAALAADPGSRYALLRQAGLQEVLQ